MKLPWKWSAVGIRSSGGMRANPQFSVPMNPDCFFGVWIHCLPTLSGIQTTLSQGRLQRRNW